MKDLTPKTRAVARYLIGGWTLESIARQLNIDYCNVKKRTHEINRATGQRHILPSTLAIMRDPEALHKVFDRRVV